MADRSNRNQALVQEIQDALGSNDLRRVRDSLARLHPSEIADVLESLPPPTRSELWVHLDAASEGPVLAQASVAVRAGLLAEMAPERVAAAIGALDSDDVADILQDLAAPAAQAVLSAMDAQHRARVAAVLTHPADCAGGIMNVDALTIRPDVDVDVVLRYLRLVKHLPAGTDQLMVVARDNTLLGVVRLADLVTANPDTLVAKLMSPDVAPIPAAMNARDVALLFEQRDLVSAPVVDAHGKLIGRITVDDVVDVIREDNERSILSGAGLHMEHDVFAPVLVAARQRGLWLAVNLGTAFLAAWVIGLFEATIESLVALAVLMPVVASMGGIAGVQTLTLVVRGLALGQVGPANARAVLSREIGVGFLNGGLWALVVALVAGLWFGSAGLGIVIGCAMVLNLLTGGIAGVGIPLVLRRLGVDPAIAGGVVLTTLTDVVGFLAFLGLAALFLV